MRLQTDATVTGLRPANERWVSTPETEAAAHALVEGLARLGLSAVQGKGEAEPGEMYDDVTVTSLPGLYFAISFHSEGANINFDLEDMSKTTPDQAYEAITAAVDLLCAQNGLTYVDVPDAGLAYQRDWWNAEIAAGRG